MLLFSTFDSAPRLACPASLLLAQAYLSPSLQLATLFLMGWNDDIEDYYDIIVDVKNPPKVSDSSCVIRRARQEEVTFFFFFFKLPIQLLVKVAKKANKKKKKKRVL